MTTETIDPPTEEALALKQSRTMTLAAEYNEMTREQKELLKNLIGRDFTDDEFSLFCAVARRRDLDPFSREIFAVKRWDAKLGRMAMAVQVSIDGLRKIAVKSGLYGGPATTYWCGKDGKWTDTWFLPEPPAAAKVGVYRKGFVEPLYVVAHFDEYSQKTKEGALSGLWAKMPRTMIAKCAEALALRRAFPQELSGLYSVDEMAQADNPRVAAPARSFEKMPEKPVLDAEIVRPVQREIRQAAPPVEAAAPKSMPAGLSDHEPPLDDPEQGTLISQDEKPGEVHMISKTFTDEGKMKHGEPYTKTTALLGDGRKKASTFSKTDGEILRQAEANGSPVRLTLVKSGAYLNILEGSVEIVEG